MLLISKRLQGKTFYACSVSVTGQVTSWTEDRKRATRITAAESHAVSQHYAALPQSDPFMFERADVPGASDVIVSEVVVAPYKPPVVLF